jgi:uncharacterized tellurite resistance protein B-like protein
MFFSNGLKSSLFSAFATHPPLEERIKAIDPTWDGTFKAVAPYAEEASPAPRRATPPPIFGTATAMGFTSSAEAIWQKPPPIRAQNVLPNLGNVTPLHLRYAEEFHEAIPEDIRRATREPLGAAALVFALLLDEDAALHDAQFAELARQIPAAHAKLVPLTRAMERLPSSARLPLVNLALPALRQLSAGEYRQFIAALQWLVESDGAVDLFEFALQKIIQRHLQPQFGQVRRVVVQYYSIKPLVDDCAVLLSALAHVGSDDAAQQQTAFATGVPHLRSPEAQPGFYAPGSCGLVEINAALDRLALAAPQIKKNLLEACVQVVGADGVVQEREAELLRAIADTLDCPIPPFLAGE